MEELKQFQGSTFDAISRRKLVEDRDSILELTGKIQELQNEVNCMTREILKMLNQIAVDYPTFPVNRSCFHFIVILAECKAVLWECSHGVSGNVFVNPPASSSSLYLGQGFNPWTYVTSEHTSPHVTSERQTPDRALDPRC